MGKFKVIKKGVHRPLTMGLQIALGKKDGGYYGPKSDGFFGPETEKALIAYQAMAGLEETAYLDPPTWQSILPDIPPEYLIFELIACFEVGFIVNNAWASSGDCEDGNGINYGPMQLNRAKGSVQTFEKYYMPPGQIFEDFYGTPEGAEAQARFFLDIQIGRAKGSFRQIFPDSPVSPRMIGLIADASNQGGAPFPSHPAIDASLDRNWPPGEAFETWRTLIKSNYEGIGYLETSKVHVAFMKSLNEAALLGIAPEVAYAELHPRSGIEIWLNDQLSRRRIWSEGTGKVHGETVDLIDFGI